MSMTNVANPRIAPQARDHNRNHQPDNGQQPLPLEPPHTSTPPYGRRRDRPDTEPARDRISTRAMVHVPTRFDVRTCLPAHESVVLLRAECRREPREPADDDDVAPPSKPCAGDLRDSRRAGVRTCFQLPAVLTTPANRASPSEVPAAPPAVTSTRSQSQRSSSQRATARRCRSSSLWGDVALGLPRSFSAFNSSSPRHKRLEARR